jgi:DNA-binding NarL/FixJ family response regulator
VTAAGVPVAAHTAPLRVVLADDHPMFRHGLRQLLEQVAGAEVVAEAADGAAAVAAVLETRPDVVVMELQMPGLTGVEATRRLTAQVPGTRVLVLTMSDDEGSVFAALRAGAAGYVLKGCEGAEFLRAVSAVAAGDTIYGGPVAGLITSRLVAGTTGPFPELSARERDVLELIAQGRSNGGIARTLFLSEKTVKNNITAVFAKLGVAGRAEAIVRARQAGLGGADGPGVAPARPEP